jgi:hypothetical protein
MGVHASELSSPFSMPQNQRRSRLLADGVGPETRQPTYFGIWQQNSLVCSVVRTKIGSCSCWCAGPDICRLCEVTETQLEITDDGRWMRAEDMLFNLQSSNIQQSMLKVGEYRSGAHTTFSPDGRRILAWDTLSQLDGSAPQIERGKSNCRVHHWL